MKKYLLLIPLLFVMLLNCITFGQVVAANSGIDYSQYFKDPEEITPYLDCFDVDFIKPYVTEFITSRSDYSRLSNAFGDDLLSFNNYFYSVYTTTNNYNEFKNKKKDANFFIDFVEIKDTDAFYEDDEYAIYKGMYNIGFYFTISPDGSVSDVVYRLSNTYWYEKIGFYYDKISANHLFFEYSGTPIDPPPFPLNIQSSLDSPKYHFFIDTTIPDFTYPDGISKPGLNISVSFDPALEGSVNRMTTDAKGNNSFYSSMKMNIKNNSSFPIQYSMYIVKKKDNFDPTAPYDSNYVFMYFSNNWVYSAKLDSGSEYANQIPEKQNKSTSCHYVSTGGSDTVLFNYSQINLVESQNYTVYVTATRCDYDVASECIVSPVEDIYPDMKQVYRHEIIYHSDFSMLHYSDVKYNPKDTSNGVNPFESYEDIQKYHFSYDAKEDENGKIDYTKKDVYSDPNSWLNDPYSEFNSPVSSSGYNFDSSTSFTSLSRSFSGFFRFVNTVFGYFPSSYHFVFSAGIIAVVFIGVIKAVFR